MTDAAVYQWFCPLQSCNSEQGPLQTDEADCQAAFEAHLTGHSNLHFIPYVLSGGWRKSYKLLPA